MVKSKVFIYNKKFEGLPKESDFKLVEENVPALKDGEFLTEAAYLSVDPYMRAYAVDLPTGIPMIGGQVAKVIESKNTKFPVGSYVHGQFGWRTHTVDNGAATKMLPTYVLPDFGSLSTSLGVGILGMPGNTAYFGFLELCQPKQGETVVVSGAAGAVGSIVGQIAKIKGCKVIGIAGSEEKGRWLVDELGFDHFINYKTQDIKAELKKLAPKGVDCYFDNVGGETTNNVMVNMNIFGRISMCGAISGYNGAPGKSFLSTIVQFPIVQKQLKVEGFIVTRWANRWMEGIDQLAKWIKEGKLKYRETTTDGFENMPKAFIDMLKGGNTGKAVVKA
nr:unnamed protein product [Callosobruchus chinensis]